jgi:hypothetical protein
MFNKMDNLRIRQQYYISATYIFFVLIWLLIIIINSFYKVEGWYVLCIPFIIFAIGFFNADCVDSELEDDVFRVSFVTIGILLSLPLLKLFNDKKYDRQLNHIIFLAMIATLFSYYHFWVPHSLRHVCKVIQSCLETIAITLYVFALIIFFLM